ASVDMNGFKKFKFPVPPLEVQREIVRILDKFTEIEAELEAELEARQKQYEHYRQKLISSCDRLKVVELREVAGYSEGRVNASELDSASFIGVDNLLDQKRGRVDATYLPNTQRLTSFAQGDVLLG